MYTLPKDDESDEYSVTQLERLPSLPIPKSVFSEEGLPPIYDFLELRKLPTSMFERFLPRLSRGINIHQLKLKDHIQLMVVWQDIFGERVHVVSKRRFPDGNQTRIFCVMVAHA